jgi:three-Cys-motif partner protein
MEDFFKKQTPSSRIKASIVAEYFPHYCKILLKKPQKEIRYLDLFAGPGIYEDQGHSTPLLIGKSCAGDPVLSQKVRLLFNDNKYSSQLKQNFLQFFPNGTFFYEPTFGDKTVGENKRIHDYLIKRTATPNPYPTLLFFDPWGYKGIDTLELAKFLENWGNEIFLFVNIKRIHAAVENDKFDELMISLFPTTIDALRNERRYKASVYERLALIMDNLANEFKKAIKGTLYHCAFKFQEEDSNATSHFIIHFTKHSKGYELVKQVYYDFDNIGATLNKDGNYTFDAKHMDIQTGSMLEFGDSNIDKLSSMLEKEYKRRTLSARRLFEEHHTKTKYCGTHYAQTLRDMVGKEKIKASFSDGKQHKVSVLLIGECKLEFK